MDEEAQTKANRVGPGWSALRAVGRISTQIDVVLNRIDDISFSARRREDTLIVVTADHECGGLKVVKSNRRGFMPEVFWGTKEHTGVNVPIYVVGEGAREFVGVIDTSSMRFANFSNPKVF